MEREGWCFTRRPTVKNIITALQSAASNVTNSTFPACRQQLVSLSHRCATLSQIVITGYGSGDLRYGFLDLVAARRAVDHFLW